MNLRNIRVEDAVWTRAGERAAEEGTNLSERIRQWLDDYVTGGDADAVRANERDEIIVAMRQYGCTLPQIAGVTGLSKSGVSRALKRLSVEPKTEPGPLSDAQKQQAKTYNAGMSPLA